MTRRGARITTDEICKEAGMKKPAEPSLLRQLSHAANDVANA